MEDEECFLKFDKSDDDYLIQNLYTHDYANINKTTLYINASQQGSAAKFFLEYNNGYFKIGTKISGKTRNYYWRQTVRSSEITIATGDSNVMRWKIYKQSTSQN